MVSKVETGFGKRIIELKQNLGLLYPEQVRPEGAGVVCLENSDKPRFYTYPGRMSGQQGETYWVEGGNRSKWENITSGSNCGRRKREQIKYQAIRG
jgi:hypothetical protein